MNIESGGKVMDLAIPKVSSGIQGKKHGIGGGCGRSNYYLDRRAFVFLFSFVLFFCSTPVFRILAFPSATIMYSVNTV